MVVSTGVVMVPSTGSGTGGTPGSVLVESVVSTGSTTGLSVPELVEGTASEPVETTEGTTFNKI